MEPNKIMTADLLDILFEGKNKAYGAYELRKTYSHRISIAIISMASICLLFFLTQILGNNSDSIRTKMTATEVTLKNLSEQKEIVSKPPKIHIPKPTPLKVEIAKFNTPVITKDIEVKDPIPDIDKLEQAQIGNINQDGVKDESYVTPPVEVKGTGIVEEPKKDEEDYDKTFFKVEKEAMFPGGMEGWKKFLERNLNANVAAEDGAPKGNYTVKVQFIVDKQGNISNVDAIEVPSACPSCGKEAIKVIKNGPKWEPAIQNGRKVIYQAIQFITFQVAEE
jgi:periplasmic protein TonB